MYVSRYGYINTKFVGGDYCFLAGSSPIGVIFHRIILYFKAASSLEEEQRGGSVFARVLLKKSDW